MKVVINIILAILVFLAVASGITKVLLMQQDVEFFGQYGFTNLMLVVFGIVQLAGGVFLIFEKTRVTGAIMVATTFLISAAILLMADNAVMAIITVFCIVLLGLVLKQSYKIRH